ncbi:Uracil phosphoribosyltransferase [Zancudomyces culisetae]|uniref:Uracil phosphoribosyltransferase n=1 Tax=Zancudomyces culisetae TaxID=1213189 RepID=A0A1R1PZ97_ZANCU|nr:Uracil phosphoribosyltransferase [Zancudomyces culisetae]|eukprot:OMH86280.1 Uracil phosphoribosyltransferase [Zancudomyces culisetae]
MCYQRRRFTISYSDHPVEYYSKLPTECNVDECIILDPVIDTGSTADAAISIVKSWCKNADGFGKSDKKVKFITVCASKAGLDKLRHSHPDVEYYTAAIDETLSSNGSIEPGIGDCGNRLFGP